jgi:hypothetical protein
MKWGLSMDPELPQDARPMLEDAVPTSDSRAIRRAAHGRRALNALLLLGPICLLTAATAPAVGIGIIAAFWAGDTGAKLFALLAGFAVLTLVIALASRPGRALIRSGDVSQNRLRWAAGVCLLGTLLIAMGTYVWHRDPAPFGSAPTRIWLVGAAYALAAAARSRPRALRNVALTGFGAATALTLSLAVISASSRTSVGTHAPEVAPPARIPSNLLLVGNTPAGYRPVAGSVSEDGGGPSPFLATYTCVSSCQPDSSPGQAPSIIFEAAQAGPGTYSSYNALCGSQSTQGYVCSDLGPDMWRAAIKSSPTVYQIIIYEHGGVEFTLQAPPSMAPQLLRAYMLSIHRASTAELTSLLKGYPNYS